MHANVRPAQHRRKKKQLREAAKRKSAVKARNNALRLSSRELIKCRSVDCIGMLRPAQQNETLDPTISALLGICTPLQPHP